jgi:ATP-dependent RNA helicase DeaD
MKFSDLNLNPLILQALKKMSYTDTTPIQAQTLPHILEGKDLLATAETGSGKTGACGVPLVQRIDTTRNEIQALILVPTRELSLQYVEEIGSIAQFMDVHPFAIYGGFDMDIQKAKLQSSVHILVATPGRLIDLIYQGRISLSSVATLVLDEADEMLKLGFLEDINFVISCLIHEHQTLLFSATMPPEVKHLAETYLKEPVIIELNLDQRAPQSLEHQFVMVRPANKVQFLLDYFKQQQLRQAIVFCNSRINADKLFTQLRGQVPSLEIIHGGLEQPKRTSIIRRFRRLGIVVMIATDLAGRGLDFLQVSHIINYNFPQNNEIYTHRTGRAARMGRKGIALTLVSDHELHAFRRLVRVNKITPTWLGEEPTHAGTAARQGRPQYGRRNRPGRGRQPHRPARAQGSES